MTEPDRPNLTLGQPPGSLKARTGPIPRRWLWAFVALQTVMLLCLIGLLMRPTAPAASARASQAAADSADLRATALELEERGLDAQAARAWQSCLEADPDASDRAEIFYRIGGLYLEADEFVEAAAALVRSEMAAAGDDDLQRKIGPKLIECLRRLGRFGEVGRELSRQVEAGGEETGEGTVLATLAGEELTEADLDRMIERRVDRILAMQGVPGDEAARQAVLRQFNSPQARRQILQELLQTELFCRRARDLKLDREEDFLQARRQLEQDLLASRFLAGQLEKIRPTDVDLQSYYKANPDRYQEPESAEVRTMALDGEEDAAALLAKVSSADDFRKLAAKRGSTVAAPGESPPPRVVVRGRFDPLLGDVEPVFALGEGEWANEEHVNGGQKYLVLVEKKTPARIPPFAEVRPRVEADYARIKQQELTEELFRDLLTRYEVRIVPPDDQDKEPAKPAEGESKTDDESDDAASQSDNEETS
jgi:peptidyl-prolyl cis-trans isomerase C